MQNRRLLFTVIIKCLVVSGLLVLTIVFLNSLFTSDSNVNITVDDKLPSVIIDINGMRKGQIKKTRWNNKEVAVLLRQFPENLTIQKIDNLKKASHPSIQNQTRSQDTKYFVYINTGDSNNCPLFYSTGQLKDVCTSNTFDEAGRGINVNSQSFMLKIPPHHFKQNTLVIGHWQP